MYKIIILLLKMYMSKYKHTSKNTSLRKNIINFPERSNPENLAMFNFTKNTYFNPSIIRHRNRKKK